MEKAICCECVEDSWLKQILIDEGQQVLCTVCDETENFGVTVERFGELLEPVLRENYEQGQTVKKFGNDDSEWWEQEGEPISQAVQEVLGQCFDFEDEIADAVVHAENYWPGDGDEPYWDSTSYYVRKRVYSREYFARWDFTLATLKHQSRFFNRSAQALFTSLFDGVDNLKAWTGSAQQPVVRTLKSGTKLFRARVCTSRQVVKDIWSDPLKHAGPPSPEYARAGRMNADGVVVFYGARDVNTCVAEMRPAIANELAVIALEITKPLRVLDFTRLETSFGGNALSHFQPDFAEQVERRKFLRKVHRLISQPIVPGREADYLITQTMAEYLANIHPEPFDGILFASAQRANGINVVLFSDSALLVGQPGEEFSLKYVEDSVTLISMTSIKYKHRKVDVTLLEDGELFIYSPDEDDGEDD